MSEELAAAVALVLAGVGASAVIAVIQKRKWSQPVLLAVAITAFVGAAFIFPQSSLLQIDYTSINFWRPIAAAVAVAVLVIAAIRVRRRRTTRHAQEVAARLEAQRREAALRSEAHRKRVAGQLRACRETLDKLYEQLQEELPDDPLGRAHVVRSRANDLLRPWKQEGVEYFDSTIGYHDAMRFFWLGSRLDAAPTPGAHVKSSYEVHRDFLDTRARQVELGKVRVKEPSTSSGEPLPEVEDFVIQPRKLDLRRK